MSRTRKKRTYIEINTIFVSQFLHCAVWGFYLLSYNSENCIHQRGTVISIISCLVCTDVPHHSKFLVRVKLRNLFLGALEDTCVIHCDMKMGVSYDAETFYKYGKYRSKVVFVEGNGLLLVACSAAMLNFCAEWDYFLSENCTNLSHSKWSGFSTTSQNHP